MGVKGLNAFLKENRSSLCTTNEHGQIEADSVDAFIPVVVDAWGIMFQLYTSGLPWTSGGEYLRFYRQIRRLVTAWRMVGLEPTFVFDGSSPPEKHDTIISRGNQSIQKHLLFFTTSEHSRSSPNYARNDILLPPMAVHTFNHALRSLNVAMRHVPMGEADGVCVALAEKLGGYLFGQDSDFLVLISGAGITRVRGYCPLQSMMWIEGRESEMEQTAVQADGWSTAGSSRKPILTRTSPLIPSASLRSPKLILTTITPNALRQRLRLPATVIPLFASLCGNDYTSTGHSEVLFENSLDAIQRIEKVGRVLREQIFSPSNTSPKSKNLDAGEQAVQLVRKAITKLAVRDWISDGVMQSMVENIIESTFQYILPSLETCCEVYPFCGGVNDFCESDPSDVNYPVQKAYAVRQRRGTLGGINHAYLAPDRIYLWAVLEDPAGPSMRGAEGLKKVRTSSYEIASDALGGFRWKAAVVDSDEVVESPIPSPTPVDEEDDTTLVDDDIVVNMGKINITQTDEAEPTKPLRVVTEYVRQGSSHRIASHDIILSPPTHHHLPLAPLPTRLTTYLSILNSNTPSILSLPSYLHPLVACLRTCIILASARSHTHHDTPKWRYHELLHIIRATLGSHAAWSRPPSKNAPSQQEEDETSWPPLQTRNCNLVSQITAVMVDALVLAQALLLDDEEDTMTHMVPFKFVSGVALHSVLLGGEAPVGVWRWTLSEERVFERVVQCVGEGLDGEVVGWGEKREGKVGGEGMRGSGDKRGGDRVRGAETYARGGSTGMRGGMTGTGMRGGHSGASERCRGRGFGYTPRGSARGGATSAGRFDLLKGIIMA